MGKLWHGIISRLWWSKSSKFLSAYRRFLLALREFATCKKLSLDFKEALGLIQIARDERCTQGGSRGVSREAQSSWYRTLRIR